MAAITAMDISGPRINVSNILIPDGGLILTVEWQYAGTLLAIIPFIHLALIIIVIWMVDHVVVRQESPLATAMLFRPVIEHLEHGALLTSKEILATRDKGDRLVYTYDHTEDNIRHLRAKSITEKSFQRSRFEDGLYR